MNIPPMIMRMKIRKPDRDFGLWLPLFIIIPLVGIIAFALFLVVLPILLIAVLVMWRRKLWRRKLWRPLIFFWPAVITLGTALRGLEVDINKKGEQMFLSFK